MPKHKRPFVVEIEAKLPVQAFDEDSARKKVEKAFATGRVLGVDVEAGAGVWTYAVVPPEDASGAEPGAGRPPGRAAGRPPLEGKPSCDGGAVGDGCS